jgi:translation initiation factor IF-2
MAKMRIYELAKELGLETKPLLDILDKEGIHDKKSASALEDSEVELVRKKYGSNNGQATTTTTTTKSAKVSEKKAEAKPHQVVEKKAEVKTPEVIEKKVEVKAPEVVEKKVEVKAPAVVEKKAEENDAPVEKSGISSSIKERMALKSQSLKDKFSSRVGLKDKLAMRSKGDTAEEVKEVAAEAPVLPKEEKAPDTFQAPETVRSTVADQGKKKLKEIGSTEAPARENKDKAPFNQGQGQQRNFREHGAPQDRRPVQTPSSSIAVIDKSTENRPAAAGAPTSDTQSRNKKKKEREAEYKKKQAQEEERQLAKAAATKKKRKDDKKEDEAEVVIEKEIEIFDGMNVKEIADKLHIKETEIIKELFMKGIMVTVNQTLNKETISKIVLEHGFTIKEAESREDEILERKVEEMSQDESLLETRPPVVTIMGHVDHGKTSLLDVIRKTKITEGEAGGITQHIGAYQVHAAGRLITFLDTPGHEAFTAMRARGAKATDIAILVVAADDGVMPQTIEAINHAKAASVPIIVAINKMDKPDANPDRIKQQLAEHELVPEDWGGNTVTVPVSARAKMGLDDLLEMIILTADLQEFKANPNKMAQGVIIESKLDKGKGPVATVLIQAGTLKVGDNFVVGTVHGKVRAMFNYLGQQVKEALPSMPVQVIGYDAVPAAGELFRVVGSDKEARDIAEKAQMNERERAMSPVRTLNLESISEQIVEGKIKELNLVIKTDVQGSGEALTQSLSKLAVDDVKMRIIHSAVGDLTETDISLASASSAIVIAFNVRVDQKLREYAEKERVDIRTYNIIYRVIEDVQKALEGLLEPEMEEVMTGKANVRAIFTIGKSAVVAGCYVTEGKITRNGTVKLYRGTELIHTGKIDALKRFKDDVKEVATGFECGLSLEKFNDIQENDIIESYVLQAKVR